MKSKAYFEKIGYDIETVRRWKQSSIKSRLLWLESALQFGKAKKKIVQ